MDGNTKEIFYRERKAGEPQAGYLWAWKESIDARVFGRALSLDEIERRAKRLFPNREIALLRF